MKGKNKGCVKTGGRCKGTPNQITRKTREFIEELIQDRYEQLKKDFDSLTPSDRIKALVNLLPYITPKMSDISAELNNSVKIDEICFGFEEEQNDDNT